MHSSRLVSSIEGFTRALLAQLKSFFKGLKKKLLWHGPVSEALHAICAQQMEATQARVRLGGGLCPPNLHRGLCGARDPHLGLQKAPLLGFFKEGGSLEAAW